MISKYGLLSVALAAAMLLPVSCRKEETIVPPTRTEVTDPGEAGEIAGFFLLNEGQHGQQQGYPRLFRLRNRGLHQNIYAERNPGVVKELGDVGNDIQIHGDKLYAVINCSHFVEVMDVRTARHITQISIPNCRYIAFKGRYAYVSSMPVPCRSIPMPGWGASRRSIP